MPTQSFARALQLALVVSAGVWHYLDAAAPPLFDWVVASRKASAQLA